QIIRHRAAPPSGGRTGRGGGAGFQASVFSKTVRSTIPNSELRTPNSEIECGRCRHGPSQIPAIFLAGNRAGRGGPPKGSETPGTGGDPFGRRRCGFESGEHSGVLGFGDGKENPRRDSQHPARTGLYGAVQSGGTGSHYRCEIRVRIGRRIRGGARRGGSGGAVAEGTLAGGFQDG